MFQDIENELIQDGENDTIQLETNVAALKLTLAHKDIVIKS